MAEGGQGAGAVQWPHAVPGIPDKMFERSGSVPITKEEARAVQISKARLGEGDTVYDVGSGSGSVTVEAALRVGPSGNVYAIDSDPEAVALTTRNLERFGIFNAGVIFGDAREAIGKLPEAGAAIVGGTGGATAEIVRLCGEKLAIQRCHVPKFRGENFCKEPQNCKIPKSFLPRKFPTLWYVSYLFFFSLFLLLE